jgi:hypothetical protein
MSNLSELLPTGGGQNSVEFTAAENISSGQAVALKTDGQIEAADSANLVNVIGLAAAAITSGATGDINVFGGINEAQSSLTIGTNYYINGSGSLTTSSTSPSLKLGQAITATTINLLDFPSVLLIEGQQAYTTAGTYTWVAPTAVTSVAVVVVSGGAGDDYGPNPEKSGSGGNLGYKNSYAVTSGSSYTVVVGSGGLPAYAGSVTGGFSYFDFAGGGPKVFGGTTVTNTSAASTGVDGGGRGGNGVNDTTTTLGSGGGGAGGYAGNGGSGTLGGGGFGNGGGVGILGQGANGTAGGGGGSGGANGGQGSGTPGLYGGGASGNVAGTNGAVRIIWSRSVTRAFPSTNTGDL